MSADRNPLRFLPTLEHMAAVKHLEQLLKKAELKEMMENVSWDMYPNNEEVNLSEPELTGMISKVEKIVDTLPLDQAVKTKLMSCLVLMVRSASNWLVQFAENTPSPLEDHYWTQTVVELLDHLHWDNFGHVNGRKVLESYTSNRQTVDFITWNQLCFYCMEDEIRKFSRTINWSGCKKYFEWSLPTYWYHKIYGKYPTKEMFETEEIYEDYCHSGDEVLSEEIHLEKLFTPNFPRSPRSSQTVSAVQYFCNCLGGDTEIDDFVGDSNFAEVSEEVIIYTTGAVKMGTLTGLMQDLAVVETLVRPPWILFIDDWISLFEAAQFFYDFFASLGAGRRRVGNDHVRTVHEPFEKVWRIYFKKSVWDSESDNDLAATFHRIFERQDLSLCKIMFKDLDDRERELLIGKVKDFVRPCSRRMSRDEEFCTQFSEHVLKNDDERAQFFGESHK